MPAFDASISAKPTEVNTESPDNPEPRRRGAKPAPIVEFPDPVFVDWIEPSTFQEALALHMRRRGDT